MRRAEGAPRLLGRGLRENSPNHGGGRIAAWNSARLDGSRLPDANARARSKIAESEIARGAGIRKARVSPGDHHDFIEQLGRLSEVIGDLTIHRSLLTFSPTDAYRIIVVQGVQPCLGTGE
jgi:hypothetical protein